MLFDPDDGKTWGQKIEAVLGRHPDLSARVTAVAESLGCSIQEVVEECAIQWLDDMIADPVYRAAEHDRMDRREAPFGRDPLVKKDA